MTERFPVMASARPGALPLPADSRVQSLAKEDVLERWTATAGLRPSALAKGDNVITMFDTIGEDFWTGGGVTAKSVAAQLRAIGDRPVEVQINSYGGDMFEGIAIYNVLREHPQNVTVKIMGMAASAASIIAMAGDTVQIGAASFLMVHNCWTIAAGNRADMLEVAAYLEPFDKAMADVYAARTGKTAAQAAEWMDRETFFSGSQAIELGFADELLPADHVTEDEKAGADAKALHDVRAMDLLMARHNIPRSERKRRIAAIKGAPAAAQDDAKPGAGETDWTAAWADLISTIRS
jgi:ATP-dependent protease ClpP protease subunit